jgi:hypothetical protein
VARANFALSNASCKLRDRCDYVAEKLPGLQETLRKEASRGDGTLPLRKVCLERLALPSRQPDRFAFKSKQKCAQPSPFPGAKPETGADDGPDADTSILPIPPE